MDGPWTLTELTTEAAATLSAHQPTQVSGRVRDLPNERLIRWYVTIGLVDPPLGRRGRVALYGRRHLLQLVAVKRRQALGYSLAQIQQELTGATDEMLLATPAAPPVAVPSAPAVGVPEEQAVLEAASTVGEEARRADEARPRFWASAPAASGRERAENGLPDGTLVRGVRLRPEVTLMIDVGELSTEDLAAITAAAGPLIDTLAARGLIQPVRSAP